LSEWDEIRAIAEALYDLLYDKLLCKPISKDSRGRCNPIVLHHFFNQIARMAVELGVEDPIHEIDWEAVIDPNLTREENLRHIQQMLSAMATKRSASLEEMEAEAAAYIDMEISYIERELEEREKELTPEQREELLRRLRELRAEREEMLRRARRRAEAERPARVRKVRAEKPREAERFEKAEKEAEKALPPPEKPKPIEEKRFAFEVVLRRKVPRVYRLDWSGESLEARVSFHRDSEAALLRVLKELGAEVRRVVEARPPLKVAYVDFSKASVPGVEAPKVVPPSKWESLVGEVVSKVRDWITLYVPRSKQPAVEAELERSLKEVERDVQAFLEKGDVAEAKRILDDVLTHMARVIASISSRAREHPEISARLGPPLKVVPPTRRAPEEVERLGTERLGLPPEVSKWARWLAKIERALMTPVYHVPPGVPYEPVLRPSVPEHPNPLISTFPPVVLAKDNEVWLGTTAVGGLAKICERHKVEFRARPNIPRAELLALIDKLYSVASPSEREWLDALRARLE